MIEITPPELIAQENISLIWPLVEPRLQDAIDKVEFVEYDLSDVLALLQVGRAQLWIGNDGGMIAITRIGAYPGGKRLIVDFIEGMNHKDYQEHMEYIEHWAISLGATQAEAELRPGMERIARANGWKKRRVKMFKHLEKGLR